MKIQWLSWDDLKKAIGIHPAWWILVGLAIVLTRNCEAEKIAARNYTNEHVWRYATQQYQVYTHAWGYLSTGRLTGASQAADVVVDYNFVRQIRRAAGDTDARKRAYLVWTQAYLGRGGYRYRTVQPIMSNPASTPVEVFESVWRSEGRGLPWNFADVAYVMREAPGDQAIREYLLGGDRPVQVAPKRLTPQVQSKLFSSVSFWCLYLSLNFVIVICFMREGGLLRRKTKNEPFALVLPANPIGWVAIALSAPAFVGLLLAEIFVELCRLYVVRPLRWFAKFMTEFDFSAASPTPSPSPREDLLPDADIEVLRTQVGVMREAIGNIADAEKREALLHVLDAAAVSLDALVTEERDRASIDELRHCLDELVIRIDTMREVNNLTAS